jgi:hypothetical protein
VVLWENHRKTIGKWWFYPLVNIQKNDGKAPFNGILMGTSMGFHGIYPLVN